ncbi:MAG TPA: ankyrin repeat domain-containing protein [Candidatus Babeliaceae bacterium]|nr:ankyrin repeat domain-containing protein [Candidatus Babeliaceae bacterium]
MELYRYRLLVVIACFGIEAMDTENNETWSYVEDSSRQVVFEGLQHDCRSKRPRKSQVSKMRDQVMVDEVVKGFRSACREYDIDAVSSIIKYMPGLVACTDGFGRSALHYIFTREHGGPNGLEKSKRLLLLLVEAKLSMVDHVDNSGNTALHIAAAKNSPQELIEILLRAGAAGDIRNNNGNIPIIVAMEKRSASFMHAVTAVYMSRDNNAVRATNNLLDDNSSVADRVEESTIATGAVASDKGQLSIIANGWGLVDLGN